MLICMHNLLTMLILVSQDVSNCSLLLYFYLVNHACPWPVGEYHSASLHSNLLSSDNTCQEVSGYFPCYAFFQKIIPVFATSMTKLISGPLGCKGVLSLQAY